MEKRMQLTPDSLVTMNLGLMGIFLVAATTAAYHYARLDLTLKFQKDQLNEAFKKIRELEKRG